MNQSEGTVLPIHLLILMILKADSRDFTFCSSQAYTARDCCHNPGLKNRMPRQVGKCPINTYQHKESKCSQSNSNKINKQVVLTCSSKPQNRFVAHQCCSGDYPESNNLQCYAKCHKRTNKNHEVILMKGTCESASGLRLLDPQSEVIEKLVNRKALEQFGKRCSTSIDQLNPKVLVEPIARRQFRTEIP
ncbi:hypothetical protein CEXT_119031 [Caerostris extrusa]|uniref:Uncharacterized protein n=1 Tax=Caerostris extrusa TaxID=172846 RepID=A0AAV4TWB6_CAEEX|nr:hypothetical protein CEXT_119031 [Caerostris extrusa]